MKFAQQEFDFAARHTISDWLDSIGAVAPPAMVVLKKPPHFLTILVVAMCEEDYRIANILEQTTVAGVLP